MIGGTLLMLAMLQGAAPSPAPADDWQRLAALCPAPPPTDKPLYAREVALSDSLGVMDDPALWRRLGCIRAELAHRDLALPKKPPFSIHMIRGDSWVEGSVVALHAALKEAGEQDRFDRLLRATDLALAAKQRPSWLLIDQVASAIFAAARAPVPQAAALDACPRLLLAVSDSASARYCLGLAGKDPASLPAVRPLAPNLDVSVKIHRLWDPDTREPAMLAVYSYQYVNTDPEPLVIQPAQFPSPGDVLASVCGLEGMRACPAASGIPRWPTLGVGLTRWDAAAGTWQEIHRDTLLSRRTGNYLDKLWTSGTHLFPSSSRATSWSVGIRQDRERVGGRTAVDQVPALPMHGLFLSDLVLGSRSDNLPMPFGPDTIWAAPWNSVPRDTPIQIFFQVGSEVALPHATARLTVTRVRSRGKGIVLTFPSPVGAGLTSVTKTLGVGRLDPATYRFDLEVSDQASGRKAVHTGVLAVR